MPKGVYKRQIGVFKHRKGLKRKPFSKELREKLSKIHLGKKCPAVSKRMKEFNKINVGEKHHNWKGDKVGYRAIHSFIVNNYGQPTTCEHCQTGNLIGHSIHWASKTREYKRDRENWLRLCAKCHGIHDKVNNLRSRK